MKLRNILVTLGITILIVGIVLIVAGFVFSADTTNKEVEKDFKTTRNVMNTPVTIYVIHENEEVAQSAINKAFDRMIEIENKMSHFNQDSYIAQLNAKSNLEIADPDVLYVIDRSKHYSEISDGAFDITVKPILDLWESAFAPDGPNEPPNQSQIDETLQLVDFSSIKIDNNHIRMQENMSIDLGGIAKGYAVDQAILILKEEGIKNAFVTAGGDGKYIGINSIKNEKWVIGLQNPDRDQDFLTRMKLQNMSVATSGNYERYFSEEARVSHIADPRTGYPVDHLISTTVIADKAISADSLATALFVMDPDEGLQMIESIDYAECLIITKEKDKIRSSGFEKYEL
ncbi:FAD:protein FMN transferase [Methanosalsum natronophilum]|uniref:FAD:protein FMN transferase n=1 Tax=Methanosalsum natronophilum TaxID=768733 RepID=UPI00216A6D5D|nr:FAD:protein FMN transferase [Methanosalsum natronophilum]MCS3923102.1 thiamine biosynthesis lipoprotein [Methanosalsum natronophilum]